MRKSMEAPEGALPEGKVRFMTGQERRSKELAEMVRGVWCDTYNLYQKYHGAEMTPERWIAITEEAAAITRKYSGALASVTLSQAVIRQLEEEST